MGTPAQLGEEQWRKHPSIPGNAKTKPPAAVRMKLRAV
jgi:hypothetical protein